MVDPSERFPPYESQHVEPRVPRVFSLPERGFTSESDHRSTFQTQQVGKVWRNRLAVDRFVTKYRADVSGTETDDGKQGMVMGVFLPCMANILGVLLFLRLPWIVGKAGTLVSLAIVGICVTTTFITALSLSAVATNGKIRAGGSYFLISRSLGPPIGAAVGLCFYLGNSVGASMYLIGTVEAFEAALPGYQLFPPGDINNIRVTGLIALAMCVVAVAVGLKWVARAGAFFLAVVLSVILLMYCGTLAGPLSLTPTTVTDVVTGDSLIVRDHFTGPNAASAAENLFPDFGAKQSAFPGADDAWRGSGCDGAEVNEIGAAINLLSLWFPAVTGIMAGSNRSADLRSPSSAIPTGTLLAQVITSIIYFSFCILNGAVASRRLLLDDSFFAATSAIVPSAVQWGVMASTIGAALQSLVSAPRLLAAIAGDNTVPFLRPFAVKAGKEPRLALAVSTVICAACIAGGELNLVAPIITMFFLLCYLFVNLACFLLSLLRMPSWRPSFRFYHWSLAMFGMFLCLGVMLAINWYACLGAFIFAGLLFRYVSYHSHALNWGDGVKGMRFEWARNVLLDMGPYQHVKNWRPQVLALVGLTPNSDGSEGLVIHDMELIHFVSQLKEGKGLTIVGGVIDVDPIDIDLQRLQNWNATVSEGLRDIHINGFAKILHSKNRMQGIADLIQLSGLGGFEPNCVVAAWPIDWAVASETRVAFMRALHLCTTLEKSIVLLKTDNRNSFPHNQELQRGTIDIWWVVTDGGLLLLLPILLRRHKVWAKCTLRLFAIVEESQDTAATQAAIQRYLQDHRLDINCVIYAMSDVFHTIIDLQYRLQKRQNLAQEVGPPKGLHLYHPLAASNIFLRKNTLKVYSSGGDLSATAGPRTHPPADDRQEGSTHPPHLMSSPALATGCRDLDRSQVAESGSQLTGHRGRLPRMGGIRRMLSRQPTERSEAAVGAVSVANNEVAPSFALAREAVEAVTPAHPTLVQAGKTLNAAFLKESRDAALIVTNLPDVPYNSSAFGYMQFVEVRAAQRQENAKGLLQVMCANLPRTLLVRGSATEIITAFT